MKPLDFVRTPKGAIAIITETNSKGKEASINFIGGGNPSNEKNAWWSEGEGLEVIDSLPHLLAVCMVHPFGLGRQDVRDIEEFDKFYDRQEGESDEK